MRWSAASGAVRRIPWVVLMIIVSIPTCMIQLSHPVDCTSVRGFFSVTNVSEAELHKNFETEQTDKTLPRRSTGAAASRPNANSVITDRGIIQRPLTEALPEDKR